MSLMLVAPATCDVPVDKLVKPTPNTTGSGAFDIKID
jgi:hypothetical protein